MLQYENENIFDIIISWLTYAFHAKYYLANDCIIHYRKKNNNEWWYRYSFLFKVKTCNICQLTSSLPRQPQKKLQPIPPPDQPWEHIGTDLICDLQTNSEGSKHTLVTTYYLSKFCALFVLYRLRPVEKFWSNWKLYIWRWEFLR